MPANRSKTYAHLDHPLILPVIFHPRKAIHSPTDHAAASDHHIPVQDGCIIGARFHAGVQDGTNLLFFHGNGEIVPDYDDLGPIFNQMGINLLAVDYRGYGESTGRPTVEGMMTDCHTIYSYTRDWLASSRHTGPLAVMGRSLGSASALELAAAYPKEIDGLILESAFAFTLPLLQVLGADLSAGVTEAMGFEHLEKIKSFTGPTLVIHAEYDHIIPYSDGQALYDASGADSKQLVQIRGANHNDIFVHGYHAYMQAIAKFTSGLEARWCRTEK